MEIRVEVTGFHDLQQRVSALKGRVMSARVVQKYAEKRFKDLGNKLVRNARMRMPDGPLHTGVTAEGIKVRTVNGAANAEVLLEYGILERTMPTFMYHKSAPDYPSSSALTQEVGRNPGVKPPVPAILDWLTTWTFGAHTGKEKNTLVFQAMSIAKKIAAKRRPGNKAFGPNLVMAEDGIFDTVDAAFYPEDAMMIHETYDDIAQAIVDYIEGRGGTEV